MLLELAAGLLLTTSFPVAAPEPPASDTATSPTLLGTPRSVSASPSRQYQAANGTERAVVDGPLRVVVTQGMLVPSSGYSPLRVQLLNSTSKPLPVELEFEAVGRGVSVRRSLELAPGEDRSLLLPLPDAYQYGRFSVRSPVLTREVNEHLQLSQKKASSLLFIGDPGETAAWLGEAPDPAAYGAAVATLSVPAEELWEEYAGYIGFDAVILTSGTFGELPRGARRALEAYAASGGLLILPAEERGLASHLPLLSSASGGATKRYGLGETALCANFDECERKGMSNLPPSVKTRVHVGPGNGLLSSVGPATGPFLLMMLAFAFVVGPGSVWLARNRGALLLLFFIPAASLITTLLLVGYSIVADGFGVKTAGQSMTWLDTGRSRAITQGIGAFYAQLTPDGPKLGTFEAIVGSRVGAGAIVSMDWTSGAKVGDDFLKPRTYQEWGVRSVVESRARLSLSESAMGDVVKLQNGLGANILHGYVRRGDQLHTFKKIADGREAVATPGHERIAENVLWPHSAELRFDSMLLERFKTPLEDGEFIAWLEGPPPFFKFGDLELNAEKGWHVVRGKVAQ